MTRSVEGYNPRKRSFGQSTLDRARDSGKYNIKRRTFRTGRLERSTRGLGCLADPAGEVAFAIDSPAASGSNKKEAAQAAAKEQRRGS